MFGGGVLHGSDIAIVDTIYFSSYKDIIDSALPDTGGIKGGLSQNISIESSVGVDADADADADADPFDDYVCINCG
jgi:hypothetical protein